MTTVALFLYLFLLVGFAAVTIRRLPARHIFLLAFLIVIYWGRMITMFAGDDDLDFVMLYPSVYSLGRIFDPSQYYVEFRPMMHFHNYMLWSLFGRSYYVGFKVVTLLFHLTNTLLAYRFLSLFLSSKGLVLAAAAIYAVHPAPAWEMMQIAPNYMVTFLFFISFITYVESVRAQKRGFIWFGISVLAFSVGMLFKASMFSMILVAPLYVLFFEKRNKYLVEAVKIMAYAMIGLTYIYLKVQWESNYEVFTENNYGVGIHVITQLWDYITLVVVPRVHTIPQEVWENISSFNGYAYYPVRYPFDLIPIVGGHIFFRISALAVFVYLAVTGYRLDRFFLCWFIATLAIYLGMKDELSTHYTRLAVAGYAGLVVLFWKRYSLPLTRLGRKYIAILAMTGLFAFYWVQAYRVTNIYYVEGVIEIAVSEGREKDHDFSKIRNLDDVRKFEKEVRPVFLSYENEEAAKRKYIGLMPYD